MSTATEPTPADTGMSAIAAAAEFWATNSQMLNIQTAKITPSSTNPRREIEGPGFQDLVASVRAKGILQPILVRPRLRQHPKENSLIQFEIVAGHRRFAAAVQANLAEIPCVVRELDDKEALEIQVIENLQRRDLHVLEEAAGYHQLMTKHGYTADRISEKIGMSLKYVYDRIKLLQLTPEAKKLVLDGRITAGHAILLARLKPDQQKRAMDETRGGLFEDEDLLWDPKEEPFRLNKSLGGLKARSVREFEGWIDEHVRFEAKPAAVDPMLFPETVTTLTHAVEEEEKVVQITHANYVQPIARDPKTRTYGPRSWKRADGKHKSKECEYSVTGVIVVGPGRGEAFKVCVARDKCKTHWAAEQRQRTLQPGGGSTAKQKERWAKEEERRVAERKAQDAQRERWKQALPKILDAVGARVKAAPAKAMGQVLLKSFGTRVSSEAAKHGVPVGKTSDDLVRHLVFIGLIEEASHWMAFDEFPGVAKNLGVDVRKIVGPEAPAKTETKPKPRKRGSKK